MKKTTKKVSEEYEINVEIYASCILLNRLNFRFDGKKNSVTELLQLLRDRQS